MSRKYFNDGDDDAPRFVPAGKEPVDSRNEGTTGSVINVGGDYASLYVPTNITKGLPPQETVPLVQCEHA